MAVESKLLFHPEVVRQYLGMFTLPESVASSLPKLQQWADKISSGHADKLNEKELLPDFLTDIFLNILGYSGPVGPGDSYTLSREKLVEVDDQWADAVLGRFGDGNQSFTVALEGKSTRDPLDRPHAGRRMSAVDQCYRYAINLPCDWILVTSMRETRLYHKGSNQQTYGVSHPVIPDSHRAPLDSTSNNNRTPSCGAPPKSPVDPDAPGTAPQSSASR